MNRFELRAVAPANPPRLQGVQTQMGAPAPDEVQLRVIATSINPIDVKRAEGYGWRLLSLKKASTFPLVLGNDVVGEIEAIGAHVKGLAVGDRVIGLRPTGGRSGTHVSHLHLVASQLRHLPVGCDPVASATLPYSFTTVWLALAGAGLSPENAKGRQVLVHGASGGLGQLALRILQCWGAEVTAICRGIDASTCRALGAQTVIDRTQANWRSLDARFDVTLNFAIWEDEQWLLQHLKPGALGHATTVHPLLGHFDQHGWLGGVWRVWRDLRAHRALARQSVGLQCRYAWTVFRTDASALDALVTHLRAQPFALPISLALPLAQGQQAFDDMAHGATGRAVLLGDNASDVHKSSHHSNTADAKATT
jgi:NADPH:quinone reductase-like Zn-dependent oxidoreductase